MVLRVVLLNKGVSLLANVYRLTLKIGARPIQMPVDKYYEYEAVWSPLNGLAW